MDSSRDALPAAVLALCLTVMLAVAFHGSARGVGAAGSASFERATYNAGETAVFYVQDGVLNTTGTCTRTWVELTEFVPEAAWWSIASSTPPATAYELSAGCGYATSTPALTPFRLEFDVVAGGARTTVDDFRQNEGLVSFVADVNASSTVSMTFSYDRMDSYSGPDSRVNVVSSSDPEGLWTDIAEVVSQTDASPDALSGLFRGEAFLTSVPSVGAVLVQPGDTLTLRYFAADRATLVSVDTATIGSLTATPTPIPAAGPWALGALAGVFAAVILWKLGGRPARAHDSDGLQ